MKRIDLSGRLAMAIGISNKLADVIVLAFVNAIETGAREDGKVVLQGFGSFTVIKTRPRVAHQPLNGRRVQVPAYNKIRFCPGKFLREMVNHGQ